MTTQQSEEGTVRALEDSAMACIQAQLNFWWTETNCNPYAPRWWVILVAWNDTSPDPPALASEECASHDAMIARATALNEERVRGGTKA